MPGAREGRAVRGKSAPTWTLARTGRGGESCYWAILNGPPRGDHGNIEENGSFTANVVVTLSEGQWFETNDCGDWSGYGVLSCPAVA